MKPAPLYALRDELTTALLLERRLSDQALRHRLHGRELDALLAEAQAEKVTENMARVRQTIRDAYGKHALADAFEYADAETVFAAAA